MGLLHEICLQRVVRQSGLVRRSPFLSKCPFTKNSTIWLLKWMTYKSGIHGPPSNFCVVLVRSEVKLIFCRSWSENPWCQWRSYDVILTILSCPSFEYLLVNWWIRSISLFRSIFSLTRWVTFCWVIWLINSQIQFLTFALAWILKLFKINKNSRVNKSKNWH